MKWSAWPTLIALSYSGSVAGVRLARPFFFDDPVLWVLLFAIGPALLILLLGTLRRPVGLLVALLMPVFWLYITARSDDPAWPWVAPLVFGGLIIVAGRASQDRPLPRAAAFAALAIAVVLSVAPSPGRPRGNPRVLFVAVEGLAWDSVDGWAGAGRRSHLARLQPAERRVPLRLPPTLEPHQVWCAVASGVPPAEGDARGHPRAEDCRSGRVWDESQRAGLAIGICGWPGPHPPRAELGPADFVLAESRRPYGWLDALARGARLSTLRLLAGDRIGLLRRHRARSAGAAGPQPLLWALQADACSDLMRARQPDFASVLFRLDDAWGAGDGVAGRASGALGEGFDRALGKLVRATSSQAQVVVVAIPGRLRSGEGHPDGFYLAAGPAAGATLPADSASVLSIAPTLAALLGLPPPPWRPPGYAGSQ